MFEYYWELKEVMMLQFQKAPNYFLLDIDGCITDGKNQVINLQTMSQLQELIQIGNTIGIQTALCTGRSAVYVEAIAQMLGIKDWCICENGAYLYHSGTDEIKLNPLINLETLSYLTNIKTKLTTDSKFTSISKLEIGKEICISLNAINNLDIKSLHKILKDEIDITKANINHSTTAVDITPLNVNKGNAFDFWCQFKEIDTNGVIGVGDSQGDLSFLVKCGQVACPSNAIDKIKSLAFFVANTSTTSGLVEIYQQILTAQSITPH